MEDKIMNCPICNVDLVMSERMGIEIDYCPKCRGVWLDRGELDKIIEKAKSELSQVEYQERNDYRHPDDYYKHDHHKGYPRKKRNLLFDLFD
jgi:uncharacterized protein